jgi:hypothetical protein
MIIVLSSPYVGQDEIVKSSALNNADTETMYSESKTVRAKKNFGFLQSTNERNKIKEYLVVTLGSGNLR